MLAKGKLGSCGTFPRPFSTLVGSIVNTCWRGKITNSHESFIPASLLDNVSLAFVPSQETGLDFNLNMKNLLYVHQTVDRVTFSSIWKVFHLLPSPLEHLTLIILLKTNSRSLFILGTFLLLFCPVVQREVGQELFSVFSLCLRFICPSSEPVCVRLRTKDAVWETNKCRISRVARVQTRFSLGSQSSSPESWTQYSARLYTQEPAGLQS